MAFKHSYKLSLEAQLQAKRLAAARTYGRTYVETTHLDLSSYVAYRVQGGQKK
jgi:hypothetical protein